MPDIDVSELLYDPDFCEQLSITRRSVSVGDNGRQTITSTAVSPAPFGVVVPQSDSTTLRGPDQQNLPRLIAVYTTFRLQPVAPGFKADLIIWEGDTYIVNKVYPFNKMGSGFVGADCSSWDSTDEAPNP